MNQIPRITCKAAAASHCHFWALSRRLEGVFARRLATSALMLLPVQIAAVPSQRQPASTSVMKLMVRREFAPVLLGIYAERLDDDEALANARIDAALGTV